MDILFHDMKQNETRLTCISGFQIDLLSSTFDWLLSNVFKKKIFKLGNDNEESLKNQENVLKPLVSGKSLFYALWFGTP